MNETVLMYLINVVDCINQLLVTSERIQIQASLNKKRLLTDCIIALGTDVFRFGWIQHTSGVILSPSAPIFMSL